MDVCRARAPSIPGKPPTSAFRSCLFHRTQRPGRGARLHGAPGPPPPTADREGTNPPAPACGVWGPRHGVDTAGLLLDFMGKQPCGFEQVTIQQPVGPGGSGSPRVHWAPDHPGHSLLCWTGARDRAWGAGCDRGTALVPGEVVNQPGRRPGGAGVMEPVSVSGHAKPARGLPPPPPAPGDSHGHLELLHPLPLHVFRLAEKLEALLPLQVDEIEAIGPLWGERGCT